MLVGSVAATRLALIGKITGISGIVNGSSIYKLDKLPFEERVGKVLFVCGLSLGGLLCYYLLPQAFLDWSSVPLERPIVGGFLVGFGSAIGNGCTSGHGVCGISSMRVRSIVATGVFMTTGILTAIFTNSLRYFPEFDNRLNTTTAGITFVVALFVCLSLYFIGDKISNGKWLNEESQKRNFISISEFLTGAVFAVAMAISNMSMNNATLSFLDLTQWNPALMFVMGGAICVAAPLFYFTKAKGTPLLSDNFVLPSTEDIDLQMISGSAIFGVGWGFFGACPGPALTNLFNIKSGYRPFLFIVSMIFGFWTKEFSFDQYTKTKYATVEPSADNSKL